MKILLLSNLYPSAQEPTRGVFNLNRFRALSLHCECRVIAPLPWWSRLHNCSALFHAPSDDSTGIPALFPTYWSLPRLTSLHGRGMYRSLRPHVRKLRRDFPFDAILAAWAYPDGVAAAHLAAEWDCPLVTMTLGSDINEMPHDPALKRQIQWGLGRSQRVVAVSSALRDAVVELGIPAEKVIVQRNGVDGERFMPRDRGEARAELGLAANRPLVVYIGNFKPEKGVDVLVDAMGRRDRLDVDLAMVGSGPLETILRERAASLGIESKIRFCGRRPHDEIPRWMAAADVICLPSYREGCPNVVLEALAAGRPVVASRVGGVPELLNDETGVLVPAGDPEALAQSLQAALARCWEPESLRASVSCLSWNQFGGRLGDTLQAAIIETGSATGAARRAI